jgi:arginyl-tRNA synthetase
MTVDIKNEIILTIRDLLGEYTKERIKFLLEKSENENFGDYSSNAALVAAKILRKNPFELASELVEQLNKILPRHDAGGQARLGNVEKVEAVKPGFINFWLSKNYLFSQLEKILDEKEKFGSKNEDLNKKIIVEYSSPNIAKPFTVGHLRSTIIGEAIANLLAANGWKVYRDNHLGDWGTQFGKQIYAIKNWGDERKIEQAENPVKELVALYVKFHKEAEKNPELEERAREWFKKLEEGDTETRRLWKKCVDWSWKEFEKIYQKLGIKFTENEGMGYSESFFEDKIQPVMKELREKKLTKESEDAELVFYPDDKFPPLMILKKDGTTLYSTRDLATDKFRLERYGKDIQIINEVGNEQALYFRQLFELEKILGWVKEGQRIHKKHGLYRFKDQKMSTRKGNVIWLEDVLKEAEKRAKTMQGLGTQFVGSKAITTNIKFSKSAREYLLNDAEQAKIAKDVGIGAIKWNDLKRTSEQDIIFNWDEILNMQGDSGPYLQYTFARTQSVLAKFQNKQIEAPRPGLAKLNQEEVSLLRALNKFPEAIEMAGEKFSPNIVCNYLFDLAQKFNLFYQKCKIIGSENQNFRLKLTDAVGQVIKNGLHLLGIKAPEKM